MNVQLESRITRLKSIFWRFALLSFPSQQFCFASYCLNMLQTKTLSSWQICSSPSAADTLAQRDIIVKGDSLSLFSLTCVWGRNFLYSFQASHQPTMYMTKCKSKLGLSHIKISYISKSTYNTVPHLVAIGDVFYN